MAEGARVVRAYGHPGSARTRARPQTKGRQVGPAAALRVRALLGDRPRRRDLLIEHLHLIQDSEGCLAPDDMAALAEAMKLSLTEIYEVATFYAHFDVLGDEDAPPPPLTIRVCDSLTCEMMGADALIEALENGVGAGVRIVRAPCIGACDRAPAAEIGHNQMPDATPERIAAAIADGRTAPEIPDYVGFDDYVAGGGYAVLRECREGARLVDGVIEALNESGLRGLGGAGFPTGRKWTFVRAEPGPRYFAVNADEGEPGTFKDRYFLETDPHRFLEGMLIADWAVEAEETYVYLRDEYPVAREILIREIARLEREGLARPGSIVLRRGAGAYICGEESAMIESIEGKRGLPRHKPTLCGRPGRPVRPPYAWSTMSRLCSGCRDIVAKGRRPGSPPTGPQWAARVMRSYSVSGRVSRARREDWRRGRGHGPGVDR